MPMQKVFRQINAKHNWTITDLLLVLSIWTNKLIYKFLTRLCISNMESGLNNQFCKNKFDEDICSTQKLDNRVEF